MGYPEELQFELEITNSKKVYAEIDISNLITSTTIKNTGMFFMYVKQSGIPGEDLECEDTLSLYTAVTANIYPAYNKAMKLIGQMDGDCDDEVFRNGILDIYWKIEAFNQGMIIGDYQ